jgi:hypothetical protein
LELGQLRSALDPAAQAMRRAGWLGWRAGSGLADVQVVVAATTPQRPLRVRLWAVAEIGPGLLSFPSLDGLDSLWDVQVGESQHAGVP